MEDINIFLKTGSGYGDGSGDGSGSGNGDGNGYGSGYGIGNGYGDGDGNGNGNGYGYGSGDGNGNGYGSGYGNSYGDGSGIKSINANHIYKIDKIPTIITKVKNNIAKGFILNKDLTLNSCYIVKQDNYFAHGETLKKAYNSLNEKIFNNKTPDDRINDFINAIDIKKKYKASFYFKWHGLLTGSCQMGRESFIKNNDINLDNDYSIHEFITITKNSYGKKIIKKLENKLKKKEKKMTIN